MVVQCQMVTPKYTHTSHFVWTEKVMFRNIHMYIFINIYSMAISEKKCHEFEGWQEGANRRVNGKRKLLLTINYIITLREK